MCSAPKRCNSNDAISMFEIHVGELRATFLRNHNMRHHKDPKRKTTEAQKTAQAEDSPSPEDPHNPDNRHKRGGGAPVTWRCTRYVAVHPNRRGALPTDRVQRPNTQEQTRNWQTEPLPRHNQPEHRTPGGHRADVEQLCCALDPHGARTRKEPRPRPTELRPETWTRLMVVVMRLAVGPDPGILLGSGP